MPDHLSTVRFDDLPGWADDDHEKALDALCRSAITHQQGTGLGFRTSSFGGNCADWSAVFSLVLSTRKTAKAARAFFENEFQPVSVHDPERPEGLFTGYYEPEVMGSRHQSARFACPVHAKPLDLVAFTPEEQAETGLDYGRRTTGGAEPYDSRKDIETGSLGERVPVICWLDSTVERFFLQIQGQGRVTLAEGGTLRLSYGAKSGRPYTSIGAILVARGVFTPDTISMQGLRHWLAQDAEAARHLMWQNQSYVFFRETRIDDPDLGAIGAAKVNLTPLRSLAIDRKHWAFGTPFWLDAESPATQVHDMEKIRRLVIAQDTGSAIKGIARGDLYWGWGEDAAHHSGHMKSKGCLTALLPLPLAHRLTAGGLSP